VNGSEAAVLVAIIVVLTLALGARNRDNARRLGGTRPSRRRRSGVA
jgi:hypothetical protein